MVLAANASSCADRPVARVGHRLGDRVGVLASPLGDHLVRRVNGVPLDPNRVALA
jgi:hypothetical protein